MRRMTIATLAAICAALAIAPSAATAKTVKFEGPINLTFFPSLNGYTVDVPAIEMKVGFAGKRPKSVTGGTLRAAGLYGLCAPGSYGCNDNGMEPTPPLQREAAHCSSIALRKFGDQVSIKNRRFSDTYRELNLSDEPPDVVAQNFFRVTGRVTKKSVTGTVHAREYSPAKMVSTGTTDTYFPESICDSGVLTYTASR